MNRTIVFGFFASAIATASLLGFNARADDKPQMPAAEKEITSPFAKGLVGEWTVTTKGTDPAGTVVASTANSKVAFAIGGTAFVEDYKGTMGGAPFAGHGVYKVSADGKTVTCWWFDSFSPEPMKLSGPLTDTSMEITGTCPMGTIKIVEKKVDGGYDWEGTMDGKPWLSQKFRRVQ